MKKNELVEKVAEGASLTKADAERAINALVDAVSGALVEGDKVALKGLGTFEVRERKARTGINPRTPKTIVSVFSKTAISNSSKFINVHV